MINNSKKSKLTERELIVLNYLCFGLNNKEIGEILFITKHTVKVHVSSILYKLQARNRTEAVYIALKEKIIK